MLLKWLGFTSMENKERTKFVILSHQRTGSNWLCGVLHQHPEILMHNELFNDVHPMTYDTVQLGSWNYIQRVFCPRAFLLAIWKAELAPRSKKCVGFKSFPEHWICDGVRQDLYSDLLQDMQVKKIILRRENPISICFSGARAQKSSNYLTERYENVSVNLPLPKLNRNVCEIEDVYDSYETCLKGQNVLRLSYEDLDGPEHSRILVELFQFLGVSTDVIPGPLNETVRQSSVNWKTYI